MSVCDLISFTEVSDVYLCVRCDKLQLAWIVICCLKLFCILSGIIVILLTEHEYLLVLVSWSVAVNASVLAYGRTRKFRNCRQCGPSVTNHKELLTVHHFLLLPRWTWSSQHHLSRGKGSMTIGLKLLATRLILRSMWLMNMGVADMFCCWLFDTVGWVIWPVKTRPHMTYFVLVGR